MRAASLNFNKTSNKLFEMPGTPGGRGRKAPERYRRSDIPGHVLGCILCSLPRARKKLAKHHREGKYFSFGSFPARRIFKIYRLSSRRGTRILSPPERDKGTGLRETAMEIDGRARGGQLGEAKKKKKEERTRAK